MKDATQKGAKYPSAFKLNPIAAACAMAIMSASRIVDSWRRDCRSTAKGAGNLATRIAPPSWDKFGTAPGRIADNCQHAATTNLLYSLVSNN